MITVSLVALGTIVVLFLAFQLIRLESGKKRVHRELAQISLSRLSPFGSIKKLSILPLMDYYASRDDLMTEPGVSYLIRADDITILMDVGLNSKGEHPSPLLRNMQTLGIQGEDVDVVFLSHLHLDHLGGMRAQRERTFSISQGHVELPIVPVYAPSDISPSTWNPKPTVEVIREPKVLREGIASIGPIPRHLFIMGYTLEHSLAIHVADKGIVLIIGCGHPTIQRIIERAKALFEEPIFGIIGGLHFPVKGGRAMVGPFNIQHLVGSDSPPWRGLSEHDVATAIEAIKTEDPELVALSPHDSSDWAITQFRQAFASTYRDLKVGEEIVIQ